MRKYATIHDYLMGYTHTNPPPTVPRPEIRPMGVTPPPMPTIIDRGEPQTLRPDGRSQGAGNKMGYIPPPPPTSLAGMHPSDRERLINELKTVTNFKRESTFVEGRDGQWVPVQKLVSDRSMLDTVSDQGLKKLLGMAKRANDNYSSVLALEPHNPELKTFQQLPIPVVLFAFAAPFLAATMKIKLLAYILFPVCFMLIVYTAFVGMYNWSVRGQQKAPAKKKEEKHDSPPGDCAQIINGVLWATDFTSSEILWTAPDNSCVLWRTIGTERLFLVAWEKGKPTIVPLEAEVAKDIIFEKEDVRTAVALCKELLGINTERA